MTGPRWCCRYNSAIYAGRALSFGAVLVAAKLSANRGTGDIGVTLVRATPWAGHAGDGPQLLQDCVDCC